MKKQERIHLSFLKARDFLGGSEGSHARGVDLHANRRKMDGLPLSVSLR